MATQKKTEDIDVQEDPIEVQGDPIEIDLKTIAIALVSITYDAVRLSLKAGDRDYIQSSAEVEVGDLVANVSDMFLDESCLSRVGTILEIREGEISARRLDGVTQCVMPVSGTYLLVKGVREDVSA